MVYSGAMFDIANPELDDFKIEDIAHALSNMCRYGGHSKFYYSVAQHSFYASYMVQPKMAMASLMHDATEAYMHDLPRPLKALLPDYKKMENTLGCQIALAFGLPVGAFEDPDIKVVDDKLMALEATVMCNNPHAIFAWVGHPDASIFDVDRRFEPWEPPRAEKMFLDRYHDLRTNGDA